MNYNYNTELNSKICQTEIFLIQTKNPKPNSLENPLEAKITNIFQKIFENTQYSDVQSINSHAIEANKDEQLDLNSSEEKLHMIGTSQLRPSNEEKEMPLHIEKTESQRENVDSYELPNSEGVVRMILEQEKNEDQKETEELESQGILTELFIKDDSYWQTQERLYLKIEEWVRKNGDNIPSWQVAGPLNYCMSLEEMKHAMTKKFKGMVKSGNLITEKQLTNTYNREFFYSTTNGGSKNLTRIWGTEFLKSNLRDDKTLNVPEHFLIVDDSATEIEVEIWHNQYPCVSVINHAYILSKKIEGEKRAWEYRLSDTLNKLQYRDFADSGNIIRDSEGVGWVVDTEMKSFDPPQSGPNFIAIQNYLRKRFKVLSGEDNPSNYHTLSISLADVIK